MNSLRGLSNPHEAQRKSAAKRLVSTLDPRHTKEVVQHFETETSPEVYKWLGMALARTRHPAAVDYLTRKLEVCRDQNARDWLRAACAVASPIAYARDGVRMLNSTEATVNRDGAILLWGVPRLDEIGQRRLQKVAGDSSDADVRRWSLLALHQHDDSVAPAVLLDNLHSSDYLLREWSLHAMVRFPLIELRSAIETIVADPISEHPRVLEWAVHAFSALDPVDDEIDHAIIGIHANARDPGVAESCLAELGKRLRPPGLEYLESYCDEAEDGTSIGSIFSLRDPSMGLLPRRLGAAVARAAQRLDAAGVNLEPFYDEVAVPRTLEDHVDALLARPEAYIYVQSRIRGRDLSWEGTELEERSMKVGVVVALLEEYRVLDDLWALRHEIHAISGLSYYRTQLASEGPNFVDIVVALVGRKGPTFAVDVARSLVTDHHPEILASVGISGALHPDDVSLGDVVIGESSTDYLANFKAEDATRGFEFTPGTETFRSDSWLADRAARLEIEDRDRYSSWIQEQQRERGSTLEGLPKVAHGPIAAAPGVVASEQFQTWVRRLNRAFLAVDMESAAVAQASWTSIGDQCRLLLIRGISDLADRDKSRLDANSKSQVRRLAMHAAGTYLEAVLTSLAAREG